MEPNKVVQALKVLQEEGREDLLIEGVLEQAWVGLRRRKRLSSEGVTATMLACTSPEQVPKEFKFKCVSGRKVALSPERVIEVPGEEAADLHLLNIVQRGGVRYARRSGACFRQRLVSGIRGVGLQGEVAGVRFGLSARREEAGGKLHPHQKTMRSGWRQI
ncbi:hypothetical protein NDU88_003597 [Pleurodeles waltl]|uniref:Uncharacterized protein n=1 Tax=Pleurodeles waltl TaxID=8319 RepID=A0AAV7W633_PLEWA|nr:hypothetical protein NDU88_003597 [Pleurodeles waltl]